MLVEKTGGSSKFFKSSDIEEGVFTTMKITKYEKKTDGKYKDKDGFSHVFYVDLGDGVEKEWGNNSWRFRAELAKNEINPGDSIKVTWTGKGFDTKWTVKKAEKNEVNPENTGTSPEEVFKDN